MIRGLIFDFDGLILDTEGPIYQSWVELFQSHGVELPMEFWGTIIGTSSHEHLDIFGLLEEKVGRKLDREHLDPKRTAREMELVFQEKLLPGVVDLILSGHDRDLKLGIASSSRRDWVVGHLTRLKLIDYFEAVHTSDDVESTKPDPALYLLALKTLGLESREAIVFEDSPNGVTAAKSAGIYTVAVPNMMTRKLNLNHADLKLDTLADLPLDEIILKAEA